MIREIEASLITEKVRELCINSNYFLNDDIKEKLLSGLKNEKDELPRNILEKIIKNADIACNEKMPICQDTGIACVFIEIGRDIHIKGNIEDAVNEGVRQGYKDGYLRSSVVSDPLFDRKNTKDNTPAMIYYNFTDGNNIKIIVAPKGFGSENMSKIKMLTPADGVEGIKKFVLQTVREAGANPCPPIIIGVGIGGTFDKAAYLAKKALLRPINTKNSDERYARLEEDLLEEVNKLGIGPQGFGGSTTALGLNIEWLPTHIAGLPVAVNINCHATRHLEALI